jgi:glutamyl/glutaminyl-tRNA synthetase
LFGCLRAACTGRAVSPPLFGTLAIMGRALVLQRVDAAATLLRDA